MSLGQMLWSRRTVFMALATGAPVVIAVLLRVIHEMGLSSFRINGVPVPGPVIFGGMIWLLYLRFIVPVLGAFYGTSLISDEVEDRTITYLFTRPVPRGAVIIGKYLAYRRVHRARGPAVGHGGLSAHHAGVRAAVSAARSCSCSPTSGCWRWGSPCMAPCSR